LKLKIRLPVLLTKFIGPHTAVGDDVGDGVGIMEGLNEGI
jgi:hypothetical protein